MIKQSNDIWFVAMLVMTKADLYSLYSKKNDNDMTLTIYDPIVTHDSWRPNDVRSFLFFNSQLLLTPTHQFSLV